MWKNYKLFSFDVETYGLDVYHRQIKIYSYSIGWVDKNYNIQTRVYKYVDKGKIFLQKFLENPYYIKIAHNYKYELSILKTNKIFFNPKTIWHDTMIQNQLLFNTCHSHSLDSIAYDFFGISRDFDIQFKKYMQEGLTVDKIPQKFLFKYQTLDAIRPILIHYLLFPKIYKNKKLRQCYYEEIENIKFTQCEEQYGLMLHQKNSKKIKIILEKALLDLKKYYRKDLNLNSSSQLSKLLFDEMKIKPTKFTAKGKPSTDKHVIMDLVKENSTPQLLGIIKNRSYDSALNNIDKWLKLQDKNNIIHPNINSNWTRTGRKSCTNPNLYNINKNKALLNLFPTPLRKCFKPKSGFVLLPVDQAQIELRLIIDSANEKEILDFLIKNPNADMHHLTVECFSMKKIFVFKGDLIYNEGIEIAQNLKNNKDKYSLMRNAYKNTGFAIGYGAGLEKLSNILGKSTQEIFYGYNNFIKRMPKISSFSKDTIFEVKKTGGITTSFGRFLRVDPSKAFSGANYKIQGTAAQILKYGQNKVLQYILKNKIDKWFHVNMDLYDENIFECHKSLLKSNEFSEIKNQCSYLMENFDEIKIPLKTEWSICVDNWNDKKDLS